MAGKHGKVIPLNFCTQSRGADVSIARGKKERKRKRLSNVKAKKKKERKRNPDIYNKMAGTGGHVAK